LKYPETSFNLAFESHLPQKNKMNYNCVIYTYNLFLIRNEHGAHGKRKKAPDIERSGDASPRDRGASSETEKEAYWIVPGKSETHRCQDMHDQNETYSRVPAEADHRIVH
jgi:hypothetical protein